MHRLISFIIKCFQQITAGLTFQESINFLNLAKEMLEVAPAPLVENSNIKVTVLQYILSELPVKITPTIVDIFLLLNICSSFNSSNRKCHYPSDYGSTNSTNFLS